jgi:hypothetical protein
MLRFVPDNVAEGLLRPLLMADPFAGLYLEVHAPDWRFLALVLCVPALLLVRRARVALGATRLFALLGFAAAFYLWTFVSGNGRYFVWGLLLVGPLLVMACMLLPLSRSVRWGLVLTVLGLQSATVWFARETNPLALIRLDERAPVLDASPLRERPAVFITLSMPAYSILVPLFHPDSRWANVAGQYDVLPGTVEWQPLRKLLQAPLPRYLVVPVRSEDHDARGQQSDALRSVLDAKLAPSGLALVPGGCSTIWSRLSGPAPIDVVPPPRRGFWFCELGAASGNTPAPTKPPVPSAQQEAMDAVEARCPRFFPRESRQSTLTQGAHLRHYRVTDMRLWVHPEGVVLYQYFRAMNPTQLGSVEQVRAGRFEVACEKVPGRYVPFWRRD